MSINNGSYYFAKTAEDMDRGRVFYARSFQEQENMIPSMDIANARRVWYSDVQQLTVPSDIESMDDGTFYEVQIDREVQAVAHIAGPYSKGFSH